MVSFFLVALAVVGLTDSAYIFYKKAKHEKLVCFLGEDCNKVIESKYNSPLGIPNELIGIFFYLGVLGFFIFSWFNIEAFFGVQFIFLLRIASFLAFLASFILTAVQLFVLKEWCEYCLLAAFVNVGIFVLIMFF